MVKRNILACLCVFFLGVNSITWERGQACEVSSLSITQSQIVGGRSTSGSVAVACPQTTDNVYPGPWRVKLSSNNSVVARVPEYLPFDYGLSSNLPFAVTTSPVAIATEIIISAVSQLQLIPPWSPLSYGDPQTATLTVLPPTLISLKVFPDSVVGGNETEGKVELDGKAPPSDIVVNLSSNNTAVAIVPSVVSISSGDTEAKFKVTTRGVRREIPVDISASHSGVIKTDKLTVLFASLDKHSVPTATIDHPPVGGTQVTGTVELDGDAPPPDGAEVNLTASDTEGMFRFIIPDSVTVHSGTNSEDYTIIVFPCLAYSSGLICRPKITAEYRGRERTVELRVVSTTSP